jgi:hypothetical protein
MSNINQCTEFLSQGWLYWEESAMMLAKSPNIKATDNQKPLRRQRNNKQREKEKQRRQEIRKLAGRRKKTHRRGG